MDAIDERPAIARVVIWAWAVRTVEELRDQLAPSSLNPDEVLGLMIESLQEIRKGTT